MASPSRKRRVLTAFEKWQRFRPSWPRAPRNRSYLDAHVRDMILKDLQDMGGVGSLSDFERHAPNRYHRDYLRAALKEMASARQVRGARYSYNPLNPGHRWRLPDVVEPEEETDRCQPEQ